MLHALDDNRVVVAQARRVQRRDDYIFEYYESCLISVDCCLGIHTAKR